MQNITVVLEKFILVDYQEYFSLKKAVLDQQSEIKILNSDIDKQFIINLSLELELKIMRENLIY